jgi:ATP-dependent Clp protease ATP-binding subunit ClpX
MSQTLPKPVEIAEYLQRVVIGQPRAVRELAVSVAKHLAGLRAGNVLLIGASGTGKTTLMRAVERYLVGQEGLANRSTVIRFHAKLLADVAEEGRPGETVLLRLLERAREALGDDATPAQLIERVEHGIVFVDEVDKIRSHVGDELHAAGIRAQEALLTLIENESVSLTLPPWAGGGRVRVDSSGVLFVAGGAFEGLYDAVFDRVTIGDDKGALQTVTVVEGDQVREELHFDLQDWLRYDDLFRYGMSPQFLARFEAMVILENLSEDDLVTIFLEGQDSSLRHARDYFASQGVRLAISPAAVRLIAREAARQPRLGARALKEAFRRIVRDYELDPAGSVAEGGALMIDEPEVRLALRRDLSRPLRQISGE